MIRTQEQYQQAVVDLDCLVDQDPENTQIDELLWEIQQYEQDQRLTVF